MLNIFARILLTASAIAPVGFVYAWAAFFQNDIKLAVLTFFFSAFAGLSGLVLIFFARTKLSASKFKAQSVEVADGENISFILLYLLPLFTTKIDGLNWEVWVPIILIFGTVSAFGYSYHFNPLLSLFGWHFYKITSIEGVNYILVTKKQIRRAAVELEVGQLTEYMILDLEKK